MRARLFHSSDDWSSRVPTGVKIFSWIATIVGAGQSSFKTPMLWANGFLSSCSRSVGVTGMCARLMQVLILALHNTYYVIAQFPLTLLSLGRGCFRFFAGFYYWIGQNVWPDLQRDLGKISFSGPPFIGVNPDIFPMHFLGLAGMPRRIGPIIRMLWPAGIWVASIGAYISYASTLFFVLQSCSTPSSPGRRRRSQNYWG